DGTLRLWSLPEGELLDTLPTPDQQLAGLVMDAEGRRAVTRSFEGRLRLWDLVARKPIAELPEPEGDVRALLLNGEGTALVGGGDRVTVWSLEADGGRQLFSVAGGDEEEGAGPEDDPELARVSRERINALAWFPNGRRALSGASGGWLRCW